MESSNFAFWGGRLAVGIMLSVIYPEVLKEMGTNGIAPFIAPYLAGLLAFGATEVVIFAGRTILQLRGSITLMTAASAAVFALAISERDAWQDSATHALALFAAVTVVRVGRVAISQQL